MKISFQCNACGNSGDPAQLPAWAELWGFAGCHIWLEDVVPVPGDPIPQLDQLPQPGQRRRLLVSHPFQAKSDPPFWLLFMRALSTVNGWDECPAELADSGLVYCRLTADLGAWGDHSRAIEVEVLDSFLTQAAAQRFTPTHSGEVTEIYECGKSRAEFGDMHYLSWNGEGDIGGWYVFHHRPAGWAAILYGEWDFHRDYVYAGHRPLTGTECAMFGLPDYG